MIVKRCPHCAGALLKDGKRWYCILCSRRWREQEPLVLDDEPLNSSEWFRDLLESLMAEAVGAGA